MFRKITKDKGVQQLLEYHFSKAATGIGSEPETGNKVAVAKPCEWFDQPIYGDSFRLPKGTVVEIREGRLEISFPGLIVAGMSTREKRDLKGSLSNIATYLDLEGLLKEVKEETKKGDIKKISFVLHCGLHGINNCDDMDI